MNSEVVSGTIEEMNTIEETNGLMRIKRPHTDPIGQVTPVGDALLPLLLCAAAYCLFERLRLKRAKANGRIAKKNTGEYRNSILWNI